MKSFMYYKVILLYQLRAGAFFLSLTNKLLSSIGQNNNSLTRAVHINVTKAWAWHRGLLEERGLLAQA